MDITSFLGRFHPLVVHLPIGILLAAILMAFLSRKEKYRFLAPALDFLLLLGAITAALACILGLMLARGGDYDPESLRWHQWGGILLAALTFIIYWIRIRGKKKAGSKIPGMLIKYSHYTFLMLLALVFLTGHKGGNLTHGSEYLWQHAPDPLRVLAGLGPKPVPRPPVTNLDSADIFLDVVQPMVRVKCQSCHNPDKIKGGLLLGNYDEMLSGGESGPSIVPGDPEKSELYRRITLPEDHEEFMPAEGKAGFGEDELALIRWWIEQGAPATTLLANMEVENDIASRLGRVLRLGEPVAGRLPATEAAPADTVALRQAREQGFVIERIEPGSNFLEVRLPFTGETPQKMDVLLPLKAQIAWINFSDGGIQDETLATIGQLTALTRLNLSGNPVSDKGLAYLSELQELKSLNLYGTSVSDQSLNTLKSLQKLSSVYLWQTKVSDTGVESFTAERPDIAVSLGYQELSAAAEADTGQTIN